MTTMEAIENDPKLGQFFGWRNARQFERLEQLLIRIGDEFGGTGGDCFVDIQFSSLIPDERRLMYLKFSYVSNIRITAKPGRAVQVGLFEVDGGPDNYWVYDTDNDLVSFQSLDFDVEVR